MVPSNNPLTFICWSEGRMDARKVGNRYVSHSDSRQVYRYILWTTTEDGWMQGKGTGTCLIQTGRRPGIYRYVTIFLVGLS